MTGTEFDPGTMLRILVVGVACNVSCALLGCYLVLRRMSLLGDAISHAVLPGLVLAFLFAGKLAVLPMFLGAMAVGVLTAALTQGLAGLGRVSEDASLGIVFTGLFAVGVVLMNAYAGSIDLDPDCIFNGRIEFAGIDTVPIGGMEVPRSLLPVGLALGMTLLFVAAFWKELKLCSFDPALASAIGYRPNLVHYALMGMVATVTVSSFESVGSILVIAMLIVPPAAARLLSDRLVGMMAWSALLGGLSALLGLAGAWWLDTSTAGMMAVASGLLFAVALVFAPGQGLLSRAWSRFRIGARIASEDILATLYRSEESGRPAPTAEECLKAVGKGWTGRVAMWHLGRTGEIEADASGARLSGRGRRRARTLVRSHRLFESYLGEHFDLPIDHLHEPAERAEHYIGPALERELVEDLAAPETDPHGRNIPGPVGSGGGEPLQ